MARRQTAMLGRRALILGATGLMTGCAEVPHIDGLAPAEIGLRGHHASPPVKPVSDIQALEQQFELQRALSASPIIGGNLVRILPSGADALTALFTMLRGARSSINLEYFILENVESGGVSLQRILLDRLYSGVRVNIIYDAFGSGDTPAAFFDTLRRAGAQIVEFNPIDPLKARAGWSPNDRDHRKIAVVDGRIGLTGGINLDKVYENPPSAGIANGNASKAYWMDSAIRIEGPAVAELQKLFFRTWKAQKGPAVDPAGYFPHLPRVGVQTIRIIGSSPGEKRPLYFASLMTAIKAARSRVWLCSGYFVPPHEEREVLAQAARKGVDVRIVDPAFSDVEAAVYAARAAYGDLLEAGVKIYEVHDAVVHAKLAVVDDTWAMVGSSNLDRRSVIFNNEVDVVIVGHDTANQVEKLIQHFMAQARRVTRTQWEGRSLGERFQEWKARIWQYWM